MNYSSGRGSTGHMLQRVAILQANPNANRRNVDWFDAYIVRGCNAVKFPDRQVARNDFVRLFDRQISELLAAHHADQGTGGASRGGP